MFFIICNLNACTQKQIENSQNHQYTRQTLGTYVKLSLNANANDASNFIQAFDELSEQQTLDLYAWGTGELAKLNESLENKKCISPSGDMFELIQQSNDLSIDTNALFDPGIAPLVELWGFHRFEKMRSEPPSQQKINSTLLQYGSIQDLEISDKEKTICTSIPVKLDLGAIAKGWAGKKSLELLSQNKISNALIGFGGDLIALGKNQENKAWRVGLKNPDIQYVGFDAPAVFTLQSETPLAVFTSGDYERQFEHQGKKSHHILDPRTGRSNSDIRSVTVIHPDPVLADALATALHVAGNDWQSLARKLNLKQVLVLFPNKKAQITPDLEAITTWLDDQYEVSIVNL